MCDTTPKCHFCYKKEELTHVCVGCVLDIERENIEHNTIEMTSELCADEIDDLKHELQEQAKELRRTKKDMDKLRDKLTMSKREQAKVVKELQDELVRAKMEAKEAREELERARIRWSIYACSPATKCIDWYIATEKKCSFRDPYVSTLEKRALALFQKLYRKNRNSDKAEIVTDELLDQVMCTFLYENNGVNNGVNKPVISMSQKLAFCEALSPHLKPKYRKDVQTYINKLRNE